MEIIPHPKDIEITDVSELGLLAGSWWRVTPPVGTAVIRPRPLTTVPVSIMLSRWFLLWHGMDQSPPVLP